MTVIVEKWKKEVVLEVLEYETLNEGCTYKFRMNEADQWKKFFIPLKIAKRIAQLCFNTGYLKYDSEKEELI